MASDDPSVILAEIGDRNEKRIKTLALTDWTVEQQEEGDIRRMRASLDSALTHHQPVQLYKWIEGRKGTACGHGADYDGDAHFEDSDGLWRCKDKAEVVVCGTCTDENDDSLRAEWPCPTYAAITRELTGKGNDGG
jgi:hypothetical protein